MKQTEMSKYLKLITAGTGILFLALVAWFAVRLTILRRNYHDF